MVRRLLGGACRQIPARRRLRWAKGGLQSSQGVHYHHHHHHHHGGCGAAYATAVEALARRGGDVEADVAYFVGGLYGNVAALDALEEIVRAEDPSSRVAVVFNGDFNFFNATPQGWAEVNRRVRDFGLGACLAVATLGNVEHEVSTHLHHPDPDPRTFGCGCAYPAYVDGKFPRNASAIVRQLHRAAHSATDSAVATWLQTLAFTQTVCVGGARVAAVHGDPTCANGWALGADALGGDDDDGDSNDDNRAASHAQIDGWFRDAEVDVIACSHTCLPVMRTFAGGGVVANNGAAGIANFAESTFGLGTRVARLGAAPAPVDPLYGTTLAARGVRVEAVPLRFDADAWLNDHFLPRWPQGSPAHDSYFYRIRRGPAWRIERADQTTGTRNSSS